MPEEPITTVKLTEWLGKFDGHGILGADSLEDMRTSTGADPEHRLQPINKRDMQRILDREGRGGHLSGDGPYMPVLWIAEHFAREKGIDSPAAGRGFRFRHLVERLAELGL